MQKKIEYEIIIELENVRESWKCNFGEIALVCLVAITWDNNNNEKINDKIGHWDLRGKLLKLLV